MLYFYKNMIKKNQQRRKLIKGLLSLATFLFFSLKLKSYNNAFDYMQECTPTTSDIEGPYYIPNSPNTSILTPPEITSNLLFITGTVYANDCKTPIPNAIVDVWHANQGTYNTKTNTYLNSDYEDNLYRAKIFTDANGNYAFQTILPGKYLNGNYYRPSHIHYKSSYLNQNELTTQLYFENDSSIPLDPWASNPNSQNRIINIETDTENNMNGVFDIVLNTSPSEIQNNNIHESSLIQSIYPNPITDYSHIYFKQLHLEKIIELCNINGNKILQIKTIKNKINLHHILRSNNFPKGIYIVKVSTQNGHIDAKRICYNY